MDQPIRSKYSIKIAHEVEIILRSGTTYKNNACPVSSRGELEEPEPRCCVAVSVDHDLAGGGVRGDPLPRVVASLVPENSLVEQVALRVGDHVSISRLFSNARTIK